LFKHAPPAGRQDLAGARALRNTPPFRPLHERHAAIISVVNLKGGVGKTMVTAQLAMALSSRGLPRADGGTWTCKGRSRLCSLMRPFWRKRGGKTARSSQHFLTKSGQTGRKANLLDCCAPRPRRASAAIVPATDTLGYAEVQPDDASGSWATGTETSAFCCVGACTRSGWRGTLISSCWTVRRSSTPACLNALACERLRPPSRLWPSRSAAVRVPLFLRRLELLKPVINPKRAGSLGALLNRDSRQSADAGGKGTSGTPP